MDSTKTGEFIPPIRRGANSYKPEDIRRWGIERFMKEVAPKEPFVYDVFVLININYPYYI